MASPGFFERLVETSVNPFVVLDASGIVTYVSGTIVDLLGVDARSCVGSHFLAFVAPESHELALSAYAAFATVTTPQPWQGPALALDLVDAAGRPVPCEVSAVSPPASGVGGTVLQIRRGRSARLLQRAVDAIVAEVPLDDALGALVAMCEHDLPGSVVALGWREPGARLGSVFALDTDPAVVAFTGHDEPGTPWWRAMETGALAGDADLSAVPEDLAGRLTAKGVRACWAIPVAAGGDRRGVGVLVAWRLVPGVPLPHLVPSLERAARLVGLAVGLRRRRAELRRQARTDRMTGLANRAALDDRLAALTAGRFEPVALLYCDLDGFKPVNDTHGHAVGDAVLGAVAERIRAAVRPVDLVARVGGDEFAVLAPVATDEWTPVKIAERLVGVAREPVTVDGGQFALGLSVGVAVADAPDAVGSLLVRADAALLRAKRAGGNCVRTADTATEPRSA
jgi:diguanylate cyclase (GGDEF)-like protein